MTIPAWHEEPIAKKHDRKAFDCGQEDLNRFLSNMRDKRMNMGHRKPMCP